MHTSDLTSVSRGRWVLPGAHTPGVIPHAEAGGLHLQGVEETSAVAVPLPAGRWLLHHGAMPHRTLANTSDRPRRALAIHYVAAAATTRAASRQAEPAANMPVVRRAACL